MFCVLIFASTLGWRTTHCRLRKIEQFQQIIDSNDQSVARLREHLRRLEPERERLSELVQQRQD